MKRTFRKIGINPIQKNNIFTKEQFYLEKEDSRGYFFIFFSLIYINNNKINILIQNN